MVDPNIFNDVLEFHREGGLPHGGPPRKLGESGAWEGTVPLLKEALQDFRFCVGEEPRRIAFMLEELIEYIEAETLVDQFDALLDLIYMAAGTGVQQRLPMNAGWNVVHGANMGKVRGPDLPVRNEHGKVQKPEGWVAPQEKLQALLNTFGSEDQLEMFGQQTENLRRLASDVEVMEAEIVIEAEVLEPEGVDDGSEAEEECPDQGEGEEPEGAGAAGGLYRF